MLAAQISSCTLLFSSLMASHYFCNRVNEKFIWILRLSISGITSYFNSQGKVRDFYKIRTSILSVLIAVGMIPSLPKLVQMGPPDVLNVLLDGRLVGYISSNEVEKVVAHLRRLKVLSPHVVCSCAFFCYCMLFFPISLIIFGYVSDSRRSGSWICTFEYKWSISWFIPFHISF